jgi:ferritin-like metal-binding protein YciE
MKLNNLHDLFVHQVKDLYSAEKQLTAALPKMAKAATNPDLKEAFEVHLEETENHINRLEQIFEELDISARAPKCAAMEGLIKEGKELMAEDAEPHVLDAGLIASAQRVEHYEMAGYGCARTFAEGLGYTKLAKILQQTLDEEGATDKKLTEIAISHINCEAMAGAGAEEEEE